jgi:uncharacterized phage protein (TIGR01671 family)
MRTIKFRGKRIVNGNWIYGDLFREIALTPTGRKRKSEYSGFWAIQTETSDGIKSFSVAPETIGQFTGLNDKNCKEIYEGDVLKNNLSENPFGVVTWHNDGYFFIDCGFGKFPLNANGYRPLGEMLVLKIDNVKDVFFEVIGNIHDNPELIKDK